MPGSSKRNKIGNINEYDDIEDEINKHIEFIDSIIYDLYNKIKNIDFSDDNQLTFHEIELITSEKVYTIEKLIRNLALIKRKS
jgi:hypothetical protein